MRTRWQVLLVVAGIGLLAAGWWAAPALVRAVVFFRPAAEAQEEQAAEVDMVQSRVRAVLPAVGLADDLLAWETWQDRSDSTGNWQVYEGLWRLPVDSDAREAAWRLHSLLVHELDEIEVYVTPTESLGVDVRVYARARLASLIHMEPTLREWPVLEPGQAPLLALVVRDVDAAPSVVHDLLTNPLPLTVALSPYSPFTLRMSRDSVLSRKEVVAQVESDVTFTEALDAVPHASGLLVSHPPEGDPEDEARALGEAAMYVLDVVPGGLSAVWLRALALHDVPCLRGLSYGTENPVLRQLRHTAARDGASTLVVPADARNLHELVADLGAAEYRGYRVAFAAEVAQELTRD